MATGSTWETMATWVQNLWEKKVCPRLLRKSVEALHHRRAELGRHKFLIYDGNVYRDVEQILGEQYIFPEAGQAKASQKSPSKSPSKKALKKMLRRAEAKERSLRAELVEERQISAAAQEAMKEHIVNLSAEIEGLCANLQQAVEDNCQQNEDIESLASELVRTAEERQSDHKQLLDLQKKLKEAVNRETAMNIEKKSLKTNIRELYKKEKALAEEGNKRAKIESQRDAALAVAAKEKELKISAQKAKSGGSSSFQGQFMCCKTED
ncbi:uncharacterized protein LOC144879176 [Branchiostoma floridae x Branchiostoma japonicum]